MMVDEWMIWAAGLAGAAGTLWTLIQRLKKKVEPFIVGAQKVLLVINGRDAVVLPENGVEVEPALPGALERLERIEQGQSKLIVQVVKTQRDTEHLITKVHEIEHEVKPNNGSSIKDSVNRIERRLEVGDDRFDRIEQSVSTYAEAQKAMWPAIEAIANGTPPADAVEDDDPDL